MNKHIKVLMFDHEDVERVSYVKRLFLDKYNIFRNMKDVRWCAGLALSPQHYDGEFDILLFGDGIENYRKMGIDATFAKVLRHEVQHIVQFRNNFPTAEPPQQCAVEYGVIPDSGITVPDQFFRPRPHAWHRTISFKDFYTSTVDEFDIEAFKVDFDDESE